MNTAAEPTNPPRPSTAQILHRLDQATSTLAIAQVLTELQLIIERLNFQFDFSHDPSITVAEVNLLLEYDVSKAMLDFIHWLLAQRLLDILADKRGLVFLDACTQMYKKFIQLRFQSAVPLNNELKSYIYQLLTPRFGQNFRILFEVNPQLSAGFTLSYGRTLIDQSLRGNARAHIRDYLARNSFSSGGVV